MALCYDCEKITRRCHDGCGAKIKAALPLGKHWVCSNECGERMEITEWTYEHMALNGGPCCVECDCDMVLVDDTPNTEGHDSTMLNPTLPPNVELIAANVRRPDDGHRCDLVRTSAGIYATMIGGVMRSINQRDAEQLCRQPDTK